MFSKVLVFALAAAVANCQLIHTGVSGIPVYRSSALYGGLYGANGYGFGANLGRVAGLGALRTSGAIVGSGALGYGTGAIVGSGALGYGTGAYRSLALGVPAVSHIGVAAPAVSHIGVSAPAVSTLGLGLGVAKGLSVHQAGPVNAAVQTVARTVDYTAVPYSGEPATIQDIDVPPQESPLRINFQSKSSPLQLTQQHIPAEPGQVQVTQSEDEPHTLHHRVTRPVVQHVQEIVQPYRTLTQTVEPVIEQTHTNIAQGEGVRLTGLQSGIIGGTGVLAASGLGVAGPAVSHIGVAAPAVASYARPSAIGVAGLGVRQVGLGVSGLGVSGLYGTGLRTGLVGGLYGSRVAGYGIGGLSGLYGNGLYGSGYGIGGLSGVYGNGLYGAGYRTLGYGGYGSGLALNGLSGLSTYGTTAKVARVL